MSAAVAMVEIAAADPFGLVRAMNRMASAGFALSVRDNRLLASPFTKLSEQQRAYLRTHKTAMVELLGDADTLNRALVDAGPAGLAWQAGTPADWPDTRLLAAGEVLYSTGRMVSRHDRRYAAECAPPPGPDIPPDISAAPPAESQGTTKACAGKTPDTPPDDPLATRIAQLTAAGWAPWNAEARARSEALEARKVGGAP
jgi:hypothetical protein